MAGVTKVTDPHEFTTRVVVHSGLPPGVAAAAAAFLPWLELTCGFCLALDWARREAALLLMAVLVLVSVYALLRPADPDCGCFLFPQILPWRVTAWWTLARNLLLLGCTARVVCRS